MEKIERRTCGFRPEKRAADQPTRIVGHAAVFNRAADIGGMFTEQIAPGAFLDSIAPGGDDVRALFNHDPNYVLGRNRANTLTLSEDHQGLAVDIEPPPTVWARDLMISMERGDINQMSFGFQPVEESWDWNATPPARTIIRAKLFDVSPVTYPAYDSTDCSVRSADDVFKDAKATIDTAEAQRDLLQREGSPEDPSLPARTAYVNFLRNTL